MSTDAGVERSLWRAAVAFRIAAAVLCLYLIGRWWHLYADRPLALLAAGGIVAVTTLVAVLGLAGRAHRLPVVLADLVMTVLLTLLSIGVQTHDQSHGSMTTLTTVWAAGPVIEAGFVLGWLGGAAAALAQFAATVVVRDGWDGHTLFNGVLLLLTGTISGYVMLLTTRAEVERSRASALAERERLARDIHDGVLQVLTLVHRRGLAAGGDWAELGRAAATQESALRGLISAAADVPSGEVDVSAVLARLRSPTVTVSVPGAVVMDTGRAGELVAAVRAALQNVDRHAGADARAWVLLEHLDDRLAVTVRDDGAGFEPGRLTQAGAEGRLGVARSIRGRVGDLGGTVRIVSAPGAGTEVEIEIPLALTGRTGS